MIFCFDTNAFIQPWHNRYPIDLFPDFWNDIDQMGKRGDIIASEEVLRELQRIDDALHDWMKERPHLFHPTDEQIQRAVRAIFEVAEFQRLIDTKKNRSMAEPFVIALAQIRKATVVTEEQFDRKRKHVRIPDVCESLGVPCIKVVEFMRRTDMTFKRP